MQLLASGELRLRSQQSLPMSAAAEAHRLLEEGHAHDKLLLVTSPELRGGHEMTTTRLEQSGERRGAAPSRWVAGATDVGFWVVAFAFLVVMALGTVPSPLYGLYRARDHFSLFMITVAFAVYAVGVIAALLLAGHLSDLYGRRRLLLPAVGISIVSAIVFLASKSLAGLLVGRFINGISIGIVASTATAYLAELHAIGRPQATARKAQLTASAVNIGGLAVGALVAGLLAQWVAHPLTVPYLVFLARFCSARSGSRSLRRRARPRNRSRRYRPQRLSIPQAERGRYFAAALSTFVAFAANGLFAGLAGLFLAVTLHHPSLALAGAVVCAMFGAGVAAQFLTVTWSVTRDLAGGHGRDGHRSRTRGPGGLAATHHRWLCSSPEAS